MKIDRRTFIKSSTAIAATLGGARLGFAAKGTRGAGSSRTLVYLFLRGGYDGLNLVVPRAGTNRSEYESKRPNIQVPRDMLHNLDGKFGFHPSATGLKALYDSGKLAVVHAVGMPDGSRSHFDSQEMYELGTPGEMSSTSGWLARHMNSSPSVAPDAVIPSLATGSSSPTSLLGYHGSMTLDAVSSFHPNDGRYGDEHIRALAKLYGGSSSLDSSVQATIDTIGLLEQIDINVPDSYPDTGLADDLGLIAGMMKERVGLHVATVDYGGWDTHNGQGNAGGGGFANKIETLSEAIAAFMDDLTQSGMEKDVVLVVQSEFGRRVRENGNEGTDHGTAHPVLVVGGLVQGGKMFGTFPGIRDQDLYLNTDLAMTTDFRTVYSDIVTNFLNNPNIDQVFPGYSGPTSMGLINTDFIFSSGFE